MAVKNKKNNYTFKKNRARYAKKMNTEKAEKLAEELNYVGSDESSYVGDNDDTLSFSGGARSFLTEKHSDLRFGFKLTNVTAAQKVIAIACGDFPTAATVATYSGETVDALLTDGTLAGADAAIVTAVASNPKLTIAHLQRFVRKNATAVMEIVIQSNSDEAWKEKVTIIKANPFFPAETKYLDLNDYLDQYQIQSKKITIPVQEVFPDFQMDDQAIILLPIGGTETVAVTGVSLQVTFKMGAINNQAGALPKKRKKALANASRLLSARRRMS